MLKVNTSIKTMISLVMMASLIFLASCKWPAQDYDEIASIRDEALAIVDKSQSENYSDHVADIQKIDQRIQNLINKKKPKIGVQMLTILANKKRFTWGGFTNLWESEGKIKPAAVVSIKKNINQAFNEILGIGKIGADSNVLK